MREYKENRLPENFFIRNEKLIEKCDKNWRIFKSTFAIIKNNVLCNYDRNIMFQIYYN